MYIIFTDKKVRWKQDVGNRVLFNNTFKSRHKHTKSTRQKQIGCDNQSCNVENHSVSHQQTFNQLSLFAVTITFTVALQSIDWLMACNGS